MKHSDFVPLHLHTEYSLLDGAIKIAEVIEKASEFRMPAVAITDHGNLFGTVKFYKAATKAGLKPIIGCEVYVAPESRLKKQQSPDGENAFHLVLLARNHDGYRNLVTLVSRSYLEGFYYKPRIDHDLLEQFSGGLIGLSSCLHGEIPYHLSRGNTDRARKAALRYKEILGPENFFLELQDNGLKAQYEVNRKLCDLSRELHIGLVATNDCHYLTKEDSRAHDILLCIQTGKTINTKERMRFETDQLFFKSPEEMKRAFSEIPEAILNTREIAERCNLDFQLGRTMLPRFDIEDGTPPEDYLQRLAAEGLREKFGAATPPGAYLERLSYEIDVIKNMGFASYFLIVWDFINYARQRGIPVGPGRGSAAGSLVAYSLDITEIDPIRYNLLFERFLNPERISMPDIEVDFCKDRRGEVISYVAGKYGADQVAQIITFGTMAARAVIRDVGRAMDIPYAEVDRIAKLVPGGINVKIHDALKAEPKLKELYDTNPAIKELIDIAKRLEGLSRHASTHAAGVVIFPTPLTDYTPLYKNPSEETIITQFDMKSVETMGLLKFDFLGLKTLTVIEKTLKYLKASGKDIDIKTIPLDDGKSYDLLSSGNTTGVFQLESSGMKDLLVKLQPNRFEDLIALVALYRPGPLGSGMDVDFIKRKRGEEKVTYEVPQLKDILDETYGTILYQEQVMRIANKLAGFSMGQADILRKAMGKKQMDQMEKLRDAFVKGAVGNGIPEQKAVKIFETMEYFAKYGFNKSHSAAYAFLAYQTAYLKTHYPVEFMAANLSEEESTEKIVKFINECRSMNIGILPPDINLSNREFTVVGNSIRFGLDAVKGVGGAAVQQILEARQEGIFNSIEDFVKRVDTRKVNKKVLESLVKAGALDTIVLQDKDGKERSDSTPKIRAVAMEMITNLIDSRNRMSLFGQQSFFEQSSHDEGVIPWTEEELLNAEKETLGFYITGHPIERFKKYLRIIGTQSITNLELLEDHANVIISGIITVLKRTLTKGKSEPMAALMIEDETGPVECIAFPDVYRNSSDILVKNNLILIFGVTDKSEKGIKVLAREITTIEDAFTKGNFRLELKLGEDRIEDGLLSSLKGTFDGAQGSCPVYIRLLGPDSETVILTEHNITPDFGIIDRLGELVGEESLLLIQNNGVKYRKALSNTTS